MEEEQELNIIDTLLICPSPPLLPPPPPLRVPFRTLRIYSPSATGDDSSDPFHVFTVALSKALSHYPLAGTLHLLPDSLLTVHCPAGDAVPVTLAASPKPLSSFQLDPGSGSLNQLVPDLADTEEETPRLLALQLTRFACGSLTLGMCMHHAICDGSGATKILSAIAGFCRGKEAVGVEPVWDRLEQFRPRSPPHVEVDFGEFMGFDKNAPEKSGLSFTAFEALGAFIWRARVKASKIPNEEEVKLAYSMNIAKIMKPALPDVSDIGATSACLFMSNSLQSN